MRKNMTGPNEAEEKADKSKQFLETVIDSTNVWFVVFDDKANLLVWNKAAETMSGYSYEEILERGKIWEWLCSDINCRQLLMDQSLRIIQSGRVMKDFEGIIRTKSGEERIISWHCRNLVNEEGVSNGVVALGCDITDRKRAEELLRESEATYRAIFENTGAATILIEEDATISLLNKEFEKLVGYSREETVDRKICKVFGLEDDLDRMKGYHYLRRRDPKAAPGNYECHFKDKWGNIKDIHVTVDMVPGTKKSVASLLDITDRKRREEEIYNYQEQLRSMASELSLTEERERRRIAIEIHDHIGQTLAILKNRLDELSNSLPSKEFLKSLDEIKDSIKQTINYTRSLIFELSSPLLYELGFEAAVEELTEQMQGKHDLLIKFEDDRQMKPMDNEMKILLYRVVRELIFNMVKHARADKARVSISRDSDHIRIMVEDNGIGFDPSQISIKKEGFGFFSLREQMKHLGGRLDIESTPGHGTRINVLAPFNRKGK